MIKQNDVLVKVDNEMDRQNMLWGVQDHAPLEWLSILTEEVGEVAKELNTESVEPYENWAKRYHAELVQVAAVACQAVLANARWMEKHGYVV